MERVRQLIHLLIKLLILYFVVACLGLFLYVLMIYHVAYLEWLPDHAVSQHTPVFQALCHA